MSTLPSHAQVIIVGAGVIGASVAYHLTKYGCSDVVLLERNAIGSGTTWHSAASMSATSEVPAFVRNFRYTQDEIKVIEEISGQNIGRKTIGRVVFSHREDSMGRIRRIAAHGRSANLELDVLSPKEVLEYLPIVSPQGLIGGLWNPDSYRVDPTGYTEAMIRIAKSRGAKVLLNKRVTSIAVGDRVRSVTTPDGTITCETVINCAGIWAREIAKMVQLDLPIVANEHFFVVTKAIADLPNDLPSFRSGDDLFYGREEVGSLLLGVFDENARQIDVAGLAPDFSFGLFPDAWDQLNPYVEKIIEKLPIFGTAEIKNFINGPESFTPDHRYLLGESRAVPGFYTLAGMNSGGIGASLGAGRQLAELIINGSPTEDLSSVDVNRFQAFEGSEEWVRLSGPDLTSSGYYFTNPVVAYPARNVRLSPVHQLLDAQEASFEPICGWEVAAYFGSSGPEPVRSECQKLDCAAGLSDQSYYGKIRVVGYGAGKTLGLLASQQTSEAIAAGRAVFANERGGIEGIATIIPLGIDDNLIVVEPEATAHLLGFLKSKAPDLRVAEETSAWALFVVAGQAAAEAVKALHIALTTSAQGFVGYVPVTVVEHAADFSMLTPTEYAVGLYKSILARAGAAVAEFGPVGSTAMERRRVAHGVARWGRDVNPYRAADILGTERGALERVISFSTVDASAETPQVYAPIWSGGMCVGHVTSVAPYNDRIAIIGRVFGSLSEDEIVVDTGNDLIPLTLHYSRT